MKRTEPFEFYQPATLREASRIVLEKGPGGRFLAGGTDLVIAMKEKGLLPKYVVDLKRIPGLTGIQENGDGGIVIGALTTMREIETSPLLRRKYPFLAQSAAEVGSIQIRNRATVGGNMANATPSADVAPSLIALDAQVTIAGADGERSLPLEEFFRGPGQTVMRPEEILTAITIPKSAPGLVGEYIKFSPRDMMDLAYVGVAVAFALEAGERRCTGVRIVLGAVAPTPLRARRAEAAVEGRVLTEEVAAAAGEEAARESRPISDVRSSAEYRRAMVGAMTKRALLNAAAPRGGAIPWRDRRDRRY
ncbi:MAG TPA: xanthine dehydrogenase family protein subunit M [candidate division Zixibacteria bacterium]|nr:xanthine dehydrogenase family protein subunit M [candidate division Zixibacteria bacterium]